MYEKLDELIVRAVGACHKSPMYVRSVAAEGKRIADETGRDDMRVIDGRVQYLRRKGRIVYYNKSQAPDGNAGWYLPDNAEYVADAHNSAVEAIRNAIAKADGGAAMSTEYTPGPLTYERIVAAWNTQADDYNQWDDLGEDEKIEWAVECAQTKEGGAA